MITVEEKDGVVMGAEKRGMRDSGVDNCVDDDVQEGNVVKREGGVVGSVQLVAFPKHNRKKLMRKE